MKSQFMALAERSGITVEYSPKSFGCHATIDLYTDEGKVFNTSQCHTDCSIDALTNSGGVDWKAAAQRLQSIIDFGFSQCTDPECDYCNA